MEKLDLQKLTFFTEGNTFTGEFTKERTCLLRYLVKPDLENKKLDAYSWRQDLCFEKAEEKEQEVFPLSEEGLREILGWLQEKLPIDDRKDDTEHVQDS